MEKLVEREPAQPENASSSAPALAVQFFLIPLAVVAVIVLVYGGFRLLMSSERTPQEYLTDVKSGGRERRWPAAYELSRLLVEDPDIEIRHPNLGADMVDVFSELTDAARTTSFTPTGWMSWSGDDAGVRRYLALAIGRLSRPPPEAVVALVGALDDPDPETRIGVIWALASIGDESVIADVEAMYKAEDAGVRKMAVYALGALPAGLESSTLKLALEDPVVDVQWNAAVSLARHGSSEGLSVLQRMIDRAYVDRMVSRTPQLDSATDPVSEVMVGALEAVAALQVGSLRSEIEILSRQDTSLRVREVALRALDVLNLAAIENQGSMTLMNEIR